MKNVRNYIRTLDDALREVECYLVGGKICYMSGRAEEELTEDLCQLMLDDLSLWEYETSEDDTIERQQEKNSVQLWSESYRLLLAEIKRHADAKEQNIVTSVTEGWL